MMLHGTLFMIWLIAGIPAGAEDWKLVWSDEFEKPGLPDAEKWSYEEGFVRNNELQYYTRAKAENAQVVDGMLVLEARKEQLTNPAFDPNAKDGWRRMRKAAEFTSASIITRGKAAWTYGRIEVRAKLPTGRGLWPAIWMLGSDRSPGWPACGEIDIMENVGFDPHVIHANIHTKKYNHVMRTNKGDKITIAKPYEDFHNFTSSPITRPPVL